MPVLNGQVVADRYPDNQPGAIISQVYNSRGGWLSVGAAAVFCELQYGPQGSSVWTEEVELGNGAFVQLDPKCTGVRFRNAVAGQAALVTVQVAQGQEPPLAVVALGSVTVTGLSLTFQRNGGAAGTEPILDLEDAASLFTWTLTDDVPNTRMKLTWAATDPHVLPGSVGWGGVSTTAVGGANAGGFLDSSGRVLVTRAANASPTYASALTGDTQWRYAVDTNGVLLWGPGNAVGDVALQRTAVGAPSSTGKGLLTLQSLYVSSTQGYIYTAASNNAALQCFLAASDSQPMFKIFTQGALSWGPGTASVLDLELARVANSPSGTGTFLELILGQGLGYGTGAGGIATSAGTFSILTATLNKPTGIVTTNVGGTLGSGASLTVTVTNSCVGVDDTILVNWGSVGSVLPLHISSVTAGQFVVCITNQGAAGAVIASGLKINFTIIKGAVA